MVGGAEESGAFFATLGSPRSPREIVECTWKGGMKERSRREALFENGDIRCVCVYRGGLVFTHARACQYNCTASISFS